MFLFLILASRKVLYAKTKEYKLYHVNPKENNFSTNPLYNKIFFLELIVIVSLYKFEVLQHQHY